MNEHLIRSDSDLRVALALESIMAAARTMAAKNKLRGDKKRIFMRAARIAAEQQTNQKGSR